LKDGDGMKYIHYDAEGDILSVTFAETEGQTHTGVELSDNIVLYYNPKTEEPLGLVLLSYRALLQASAQVPLPLEGLARAPARVRETVMSLLRRTPVTSFLQLVETHGQEPPASRLSEIFTPAALQAVV
jgi:hypothetical protein